MLESIQYNHLRKKLVLSSVSGVATTKEALIRFFDNQIPAIGIITTKSFQVVPNPGNREPVIVEPETGCFGNSVGLRNCGMAEAIVQLRKLREEHRMRCMLNVSLSANSPEDFVTLIRGLSHFADSVELNFSCPHAATGYGASIGSSAQIAGDYVRKIRLEVGNGICPVLVKLTPNVPDIGAIAKAVIEAGADGIVAINTLEPKIYSLDGNVILNNKLGGKGGQSGKWIKEAALNAVRSIRKAIGPEVVLIGEGGVSSGNDAADMVMAGADAVGIGSALGRVPQQKWGEYLGCVLSEGQVILDGEGTEGKQPGKSIEFLDTENRMKYRKHTVLDVLHHDETTVVLTLDGAIPSEAGQFAFLWIPGAGEKPFSVATGEPLRFIIKERGPFTRKCMEIKAGDTVYVRGLYGKPVELTGKKKAVLIAGGTGEAVLPELAKSLSRSGVIIESYVGVTSANGGTMEAVLGKYGKYESVNDNGIPGRVIEEIVISDPRNTAVYIVGPERFMAKGAKRFVELGISPEDIMVSMEKNSMCGIGLCGECECAGRLTCQWGTFMSYGFLAKEGLL